MTFKLNEIKARPIRGRIAQAVDIENATRKSTPSEVDAVDLAWRLARIFPEPAELTFVGSSPRNVFAAHRFTETMSGANRCRSGRNGADLVIIDWLEEVMQQNLRNPLFPITQVRILSGDGIFTSIIKKLRASTIDVTVVAYRETINHSLYHVVDRIVFLDDNYVIDRAA